MDWLSERFKKAALSPGTETDSAAGTGFETALDAETYAEMVAEAKTNFKRKLSMPFTKKRTVSTSITRNTTAATTSRRAVSTPNLHAATSTLDKPLPHPPSSRSHSSNAVETEDMGTGPALSLAPSYFSELNRTNAPTDRTKSPTPESNAALHQTRAERTFDWVAGYRTNKVLSGRLADESVGLRFELAKLEDQLWRKAAHRTEGDRDGEDHLSELHTLAAFAHELFDTLAAMEAATHGALQRYRTISLNTWKVAEIVLKENAIVLHENALLEHRIDRLKKENWALAHELDRAKSKLRDSEPAGRQALLSPRDLSILNGEHEMEMLEDSDSEFDGEHGGRALQVSTCAS